MTLNCSSMMVLWKMSPALVCMSILLRSVKTEVQLDPMNATALLGSDIQFYARVQGSWEVMTWHVRGFQVLTIQKNGEVISGNRYSAGFCQSTDGNCVQFTIYSISRSDAGPVSCIVQGSYTPKTANLSVQESGTLHILGGNLTVNQDQKVQFQCIAASWYPTPSISWSQNGQALDSSLFNTTSSSISVAPDWTVLVAVVVSFGCCALLVLLFVGIIFCNKQKKGKQLNYEDEMRRVRTQSQISSIAVPENRRGRDNPSFQRHTAETADVFTNQDSYSHNAQVPDLVKQAQSKKHRHVTIV
ncbi:uncharacterized protein LOC101156138 isoform X4 [Oryzias latipes]|uniref:uncharacterized protein LOC101156138 isoform X4 n=1 Tax=Oryzias latipes TaxID=8090 RepID=UPI0005CC6C50|nr:uncharacterized protein LOC101156138 isoform X4 [Oryzias latipes]